MRFTRMAIGKPVYVPNFFARPRAGFVPRYEYHYRHQEAARP